MISLNTKEKHDALHILQLILFDLLLTGYHITLFQLKDDILSDWTAAGTRGTTIDFDLKSSPLQIQTDSVVGSGHMLYVGFYQLDVYKAGVAVSFTKPPKYSFSCGLETPFGNAGADNHRVWTVRKQNNTLQLLCNGVQIFDRNLAESSLCRDRWSVDTAHLRFMPRDTASLSFRRFTNSKKSLTTFRKFNSHWS